ncbi:hypothetical protein I3842_01G144000 [Carya illinoinensis]|uniref:Uncharacterized protein n=1 Tax=Carya illinoinensis TaxID=32201 RepID=A0A922G3B2_CARIL|nr:hypothetical protein I3842_01G144000 [Carya illinoinensis]
MAPRADRRRLLKIGVEAFDMIDDFHGRPRIRPAGGNQQAVPHKVNYPVPKPDQPVIINSDEAAKLYGGIIVREQYIGKENRGFASWA